MDFKKYIIIMALLVSFCAGGATIRYGFLPVKQSTVTEVGQLSLSGQMGGYNTQHFHTQIKGFQEKGITEVEVFVMSPGGIVVDAFGACDVIEKAKDEGMHFTMIAFGIVASAAVPVFVVGDVRVAGPNTVFMLHKPSREYVTDENQIEYMDLNERLYISFIAKYSWLTYEEVNKLCADFTWFTAKQAMADGMVDIIL